MRALKWGIRPLFFVLLLAIETFVSAPARAGVTPNLLRLADSPAGRYLLLETGAGQEIFVRLFGGVPAGDAVGSLVGALEPASMSGVGQRLEQALSRIETRAIDRRPDLRWTFQPGDDVAFRGDAEALLRGLADSELRVQSSFFPRAPFGGYDATRNLILRALEWNSERGQPLRRYPVGVDPVLHPDAHLDFGLEASYSGAAMGKLLSVYGPEALAADGGARWLAMSPVARAEYVASRSAALFPQRRREGALVLLRSVREAAFLPRRLSMDWDGSLLLVPERTDTLEQWMLRARWLSAKLSPSRLSGSVGAPLRAYHSGATEADRRDRLAENGGYLFFSNDLETLTAIEEGRGGAESVLADPERGPLTLARQRALVGALRAHAAGSPIDEATVRFVQSDDTSFRLVGGSVYRPEIAEGRVGLEVRDAAGTLESLADRIVHTTFFLQFGRESFRSAAGLAAFDPASGWASLTGEIRAMLQEAHPTPMQPGVGYSPAELEARAVHRNFAWPLRDWNSQLRFIGREDLADEVAAAQRGYRAGLLKLARSRAGGRRSVESVRETLVELLAGFAEQSGLPAAYRGWLSANLSADHGWEDYMALTVRELGPLASAYPLSNWEGALETRIARFLQRWPRNAALVDDVGFRYAPQGADETWTERRVLVISTAGLSEEKISELSSDYADAISRGTISFPLAESGDHLHARLGNLDFDWWGRFATKTYRASSWRRLEAVMSLSPVEELRLRTYIENVARNPWAVVGDPSYNGAASGVSEGGLDRNMPRTRGEGHNCTSYLCTVRVGDDGERLFELAGASAGMEVHTNPGWWTHYLTGSAPQERVPLVVRWDANESLGQLLSQIRSGQAFPEWDFALH